MTRSTSYRADPNLVAEPMEALRRSCQVGVCLICRILLFVLIVVGGMLALLEFSFDFDAVSVPDDVSEDVPLQWLTMSTTVPQIEQTLTWSYDEPNVRTTDGATTSRKFVPTTTGFQMSLTVDVVVESDGSMVLTLANETDFLATMTDDSRTRDDTDDFHRTRMRAVDLANSALRTAGVDLGYNSSRQLQQLSVVEKFDMKQTVGQWLHNLAGDSYHPLNRHSKLSMFAVMMTCVSAMVCTLLPCMMQGPFRPPHPAQHGMRNNVHQSDAGPPFVGTATLKVPPSWCVERNHLYSLRSWISGLILWASASDLDPIRHGPVAALQVQGTAKELIRELTPQQLQHGDIDPQTGAQYAGLMLLVNVLARRYAPLEAENTTKSISEFLSFKRLPGETIDSVLVRFDILRNRAQARAGFAVNWTGLSWLLLQSLGLNAEMWDRLLAPTGGLMPQNEFQLGELMERVRRLFHLREGRLQGSYQQGAMGDPGNFYTDGYFPTFEATADSSNVFMTNDAVPADPWRGASFPQQTYVGSPTNRDTSGAWDAWNRNQAFHANAGSPCPTCGMYYRNDDGFSTGTSSDDGSDIPPDVDPTEAYQEYAFARKKWRRVANKFPRRYRKFGKGKGGKPSYASFLPPQAFAGGKGGSGAKGSFRKKNPKDKSGQVMRCNICQSDEHLWRKCPKRPQQDGPYVAANASGVAPSSNVQPTQQQQLALLPMNQSLMWGSGTNASLPGVHFFGAEMEQLRSISEVGSVVSPGSRKRASEPAEASTPDRPSRAVPKFSPGFFPPASVSASVPEASDDSASPMVERLVEGTHEPQLPPPLHPPRMTTIHLGVSGTASNASAPRTSQDTPLDEQSPTADDAAEKPARMSRAEQAEIRQQSVQGLHSLMMGFDQMTGRSDAAMNAADPRMHRQVLNLETQLAKAAPPMNPMMFGQQQSFAFGVPGMSMNSQFAHMFGSPNYGSGGSGSGGQGPFQGPSSSGTFPWWEIDSNKDDGSQKPATEGTYHLRTRLRSGAVGLLVDPGAHDNLIGEMTAKQMCQELNAKMETRSLDKPLPVEGVGKTAQVANRSACVRMAVCSALGSMNDASYTAPIIPDSMLPPLLGNKTLRKMQVILDCGSGKMIIPGPGGIEVKMSPGSHVYELEFSNSGHWILPLDSRDPNAMSTAEKDLSFNMSCRQNRAQLSGDVAAEQFNNGRHFFVEQPQGSGLYQEPPWLRLKDFMFTAVFDQCMTGLRMLKPPFLPVRKTTECKASHPALLMYLQNLRCDGSHEHAHIGSWSSDGRHTVKSADRQVWPRELCERIAAGIVECLMSIGHSKPLQQHNYFPEAAAEAAPAAAPPEAAAEAAPVGAPIVVTCPACKGHMRKTDPRHTRDANCKFPDVESITWTCPGCVARKNRAHSDHRNDETCQWVVARTMPEGAARERGSTHPRDGRVSASSDPSASMRMEGREDGVPGASDALPEILSPHEAEARRRDKSERAEASGSRRASTGVQAEAPRPIADILRRDASTPGDAVVPSPAPAAAEPPSDEVAIPTWSKYDLGFALQQLRSLREGVVRRTLRKLHIRWFHCSAKRMCTLLSAAGVSKDVLMLVPSIIDTCDICRNWQRVGPRTVTSSRVPDTFNLEVQIDLLFYKTNVVLHCVDACTRWTAVEILPDREPTSILDGFARCWIRIFGAPSTILCDQEGGVISDLAAEWFERRGINVVFRAKEQHCGLVERHNQILRNQLHLLDDQSNSEGLAVPFSTILSESVFAKNALFKCGNASPYEALFGRVPPLLAVVGHESGEALTDRDAARVRH
eukprot:s661_g11.t1